MLTGADPGFPVGGGALTVWGGGVPTYEIAKFSEKLHGIEKISDLQWYRYCTEKISLSVMDKDLVRVVPLK